MKKKPNTPSTLLFGQRIREIWQELVEHVNYLSTIEEAEGDDDDAGD